MNKVVETGSNLLPNLSKGDTNVIRDVTQHILKLIRNIPDLNQNTDKNFNLSDNYENSSLRLTSNTEISNTLTRRHTQPDFNTTRCRSLDTLIETGETCGGDKFQTSSSINKTDLLINSRNRSSSDSTRRGKVYIIYEIKNYRGKKKNGKITCCFFFQNDKQSAKSNDIEKETESINNNSCSSSSSVILPLNPPSLRRQRTFDMDTDSSNIDGEPRPSPPKISSSPVPVPQLCNSLGQISLQSEGKEAPLVELLFHAKANLENALKLINNRSRASSTTVEGKKIKNNLLLKKEIYNFFLFLLTVFNIFLYILFFFSKDVYLMPPPSNSLKVSPGDNFRPESSCSLPIQSGIRSSSGLQRPGCSSVRRNVEESFRRISDGVKSPIDRKSLAGNKNLLQRRSFGGRIASPKSIIGSNNKTDTPRPGLNTSSAMSRMIIAAKRRVSPDPKNNSPQNQNKANKSLNTSTGIKSFVSSNKYQGNSIATGSIKSQLTAGNSANKFGFIRKKE